MRRWTWIVIGGMVGLGWGLLAESVHAQSGETGSGPASDSGPKPVPVTLDAVVRTALQEGVPVHLGRERLRAAQGVQTAAQGAFDTRLEVGASGHRETGLLPTTGAGVTGRQQAETRAGLSVPIRWGADVRPEWTVRRAASEGGATSVSRVGIAVAVPLLEDRGFAGFRAAERAARHHVAAAESDLQAATAGLVLQVVLDYWAVRAAEERRTVLRAAEDRMQRLVDETRRLVEEGERPAADLVQLRAEVDDRRAERWAAEDALDAARQQLARTTGVRTARSFASAAPGDAAHNPVPWTAVTPEPSLGDSSLALPTAASLVRLAKTCRAEVTAADYRLRAAASDVRVAENVGRPRLDLSVDVGLSGAVREGRGEWAGWTPGVGDDQGWSAGLSLSTDLAVQGRAERGRLALQEARRREHALRASDVRRRIGIGVTAALRSLRTRHAQSRAARAAAARYRTVLQNERTRYRLGTGTLVDVLLADDRRTRSRLQLATARTATARALARLRYETGVLTQNDSATHLHAVPDSEDACREIGERGM